MTWRLLNYRSYSAFENMAIDEAILRETIKHKKPPTLRFFGWHPVSVSIGYFQDLNKEINFNRCKLSGVDIVRRITGGKAVYHCDEVTYSLTAGKSDNFFPDDIIRTYEIISLCLAHGLSFLGINAHLAKSDSVNIKKRAERTSCCFSVPSIKELLVDGKKICGSAQIRAQGGFLQHGSMLMSFNPAEAAALILSSDASEICQKLRNSVTAVNELISSPVSAEDLCFALQKGFVNKLGIDLSEEPLTSEEKQLAGELIKKYKSDAWNWERKKEAFNVF